MTIWQLTDRDTLTELARTLVDYDLSETTDEEAHHAERLADQVRALLRAEGVDAS